MVGRGRDAQSVEGDDPPAFVEVARHPFVGRTVDDDAHVVRGPAQVVDLDAGAEHVVDQEGDEQDARGPLHVEAPGAVGTILGVADGLPSIAGDEYAIDAAQACRSLGIKSVAVSAGYVCDLPRAEFYQCMDAANIDLKAFTEKFFTEKAKGNLSPVLKKI